MLDTLGPQLETMDNEVSRKYSVFRFGRLLNSIRFWWAASLLCAALAAWNDRYTMTGDGLSYLDMAAEMLHSGPGALINGYWSAVYPALIGTGLLVFRPTPLMEFPVVHLVNFFIFVMALLAFTFFIKSWQQGQQDGPENERERNGYLVPLGFGLFLWFMLEFISLGLSTPDLFVAATVFLAAGVTCRLCKEGPNWRYYFTKAAMFPLGAILLVVLFIWPPENVRRRGIIVSAGVFLLVMSPMVALISHRVGHFTTGETGPFNYAWYVNRLTWNGDWVGDPGNPHGVPKHPPRTLMAKPFTLEYATPVSGTYPLWYDPAYWYAGATARFDAAQQAVAIVKNLGVYAGAVVRMSGILAGFLGLWILQSRRRVPMPSRNTYWLLLWPVGAASLYALVHVDVRFLGAFCVLFCLAAYQLLLPGVSATARAAILATALSASFLPTTFHLIMQPVLDRDRPASVVMAEHLQRLGIKPGDKLAIVGTGYRAYFARCAGVRIVAQVVSFDDWGRVTKSDLDELVRRLTAVGVKALVAPGGNADFAGAHWNEVFVSPSEQYNVLLLNQVPRTAVAPRTIKTEPSRIEVASYNSNRNHSSL